MTKYLHGLNNAVTRLLFKFRSGTHGLNEELGIGTGKGRARTSLCCVGMSVGVLVDCSAYRSIRAQFLLKLQASLGGSYARLFRQILVRLRK